MEYLTHQILFPQLQARGGGPGTEEQPMKLVCVFDAYCGWSYGFHPTLMELVGRHPDLDVKVVSGGLFTGPRRVPIRDFGYVQGANAKISELTGAEFGPAYGELIADGSFVMDSEDAARGVAALRAVAPERSLELVEAMQRAFYVDGLSLSDPETYRALVVAAGLDPDDMAAEFSAPTSGARCPRRLHTGGRTRCRQLPDAAGPRRRSAEGPGRRPCHRRRDQPTHRCLCRHGLTAPAVTSVLETRFAQRKESS